MEFMDFVEFMYEHPILTAIGVVVIAMIIFLIRDFDNQFREEQDKKYASYSDYKSRKKVREEKGYKDSKIFLIIFLCAIAFIIYKLIVSY